VKPTTCHTFTHHVAGCIRVECTIHPEWVVDVEPVEKGIEPNSRQTATALQAEHESEGG
jgi:hypothetical protein